MGFLRGAGLVLVCILFFIAVLLTGILLTVSNSLKYENINTEMKSVAKQLIGDDSDLQKVFEEMQLYCETNEIYTLDNNDLGLPVEIDCGKVAEGQDAVTEFYVGEFVKEKYYQEYDCEFWSCLKELDDESPFVLVSKHAYDYWRSKFYLGLLVSIILFALMILLAENRSNSFIIAGILIFASSFPILILGKIFTSSEDSVIQVLTTFISQAGTVFVEMLIFGIVILAVGIALKAFHVGVWISDRINEMRDKVSDKE